MKLQRDCCILCLLEGAGITGKVSIFKRVELFLAKGPRSKLAVLLAAVFVLMALRAGFWGIHGPRGIVDKLYVRAMSPSFADTRTVTHSIDAVLNHADPYVVRTYDPWHRVYNYPPIWLELRHLSIDSRSTNALGVLFGVLTFTALLLIFRPKDVLSSILVFLAATSPALMFAVERGNIDQVIFFLLIAWVLLDSRLAPKICEVSTSLMVVFLTVLKVFPIAAAVVLLRSRRKIWLVCGTVFVALAALALTAGSKLLPTLKNTPIDNEMSFGAYPVWIALHRVFGMPLLTGGRHGHSGAFAVVVALVAVGLAACFKKQFLMIVPPLSFEAPLGRVAICCLAIFCLAFAGGSSYNYRLMFLLGPMALLVSEMTTGTRWRTVPVAVLFLADLWRPHQPAILPEIVDLLCFVVAVAWLGGALLERLQVPGHEQAEADDSRLSLSHA
jgi:hypothetical protein